MAANWRQEYAQYRRVLMRLVNEYKGRQDLRMFTELLLSLGTIILFSALAIRPTLLTISELWKERQVKQETIVKMDNKIENLQKARQIYQQEEDRLQLLTEAVPFNPEPERYLRQIEGLAIRHGLTISNIATSDVVLSGSTNDPEMIEELILPSQADDLPVSFSLSSFNYSDVENFLRDFENLRRPLLIGTSSLIRIDQDGTVQLVLTVEGNVPYLDTDK